MAEPLQSDEDGGTPRISGLEGVSNVLLQSPSIGPHKTDVCHQLLGQSDPAQTSVLVVTFTKSATDWVTEWNEFAGQPPARGGIVTVGETSPHVAGDGWDVEQVENASNLTGLGITLSGLLSDLASAGEEDGSDVVVCFDSVTSLLQYADLQGTFRFLHVVTGRVESVGGVGHYHIDPAAHDSQDLATLRGLFDAVVDVEADGSVAVTR